MEYYAVMRSNELEYTPKKWIDNKNKCWEEKGMR